MNMKLQKLKEQTQKDVDAIVPGKVTIEIFDNPDTGGHILAGTYQFHDEDGSRDATWTEQIDRYFTDNDLFLGFFRQRADYMNAPIAAQIAHTEHPAFFGK